MYHHIKDFLSDWKYESDSTLKLFRNLTDEALQKKINPNVRSLGFLSWHMVHTLQEMMERTGLSIDIKKQEYYNNENVNEICEIYEKGARLLAEAVQNNWKDDDLEKEDNMYGSNWKRGITLSILVKHQSHHRGEMIVVMRMLGLPVVGVYGPAKEEWAKMGMEAMK